ncbi:DNA topoisomerase IV subunit A [Formicincola oecophyllae]|uniref:DNA topoisomerase 4 subunit A n=1 Tax=Formicincola oecophyllae TaxID=2558361 RepID=A0A4Y6UAD8_9PROT|nr:DNA topoisomerase IV subunit A [Formicincola oecophyllae]QDH14469.1 DNA topoisomerase IV subunit A [Formicincola oecophyllae]
MAERPAGTIRNVPLIEALSERYLSYALSTITARSLPDVRDGLKPVHRRLVYAMHELKLNPEAGFKKCARVVGDVIGKYHPHGDAAVYDALVRLAQDFAARYPLVEGQGNFGSIDGDGAAAMRYTESRLTFTAQVLLEGIGDDATDFRPTYDGENHEPTVMPGLFPNLLANGAAGIAVGMATNIPPHNAVELYNAAVRLAENPAATVDDLLVDIGGPDFPTGGVLVEDKATLKAAYESGRGAFRVRARWQVEDLGRGQWQVVVTELPYQVQKGRLIEQIASAMEKKKLPLLADVRDESAENVRLVLEPKNRSVAPEMLMETLFRTTPLENRFSLNMNVLDATGVPGVHSLKAVLQAWLDHAHDVFKRRAAHRLEGVRRRLAILDALMTVYLHLDSVIAIIRDEDDPKAALMAAHSLDEMQANAILDMRLRSLKRLEEASLRKERTALAKEAATLEGLLGSERKRWRKLVANLRAMAALYAARPEGARRTSLAAAPAEVDVSAAVEDIEREPVTVVLSRQGWLRALKGHGLETDKMRFKDGDEGWLAIECESTDKLALMSSGGRAFTLAAADMPRGRGHGKAVRTIVDVPPEDQVVALFPLRDDECRLFTTAQGRGMKVRGASLAAEKRTGRQVVNLREGDSLAHCQLVEGDSVLLVGSHRKALAFPLEHVPEVTRGQGVQFQRLPEGAFVREVRMFDSAEGLVWRPGQRQRKPADLEKLFGRRGAVGRQAPQWMLREA